MAISKEIKQRGGIIKGASHRNGGVPFILDTGAYLEAEGNEVNIPRELIGSNKIYEFEGTNRKILNKILNLEGCSLKNEVKEIYSGDIVIRNKSVWDKTPRKYKGSITQILSAINESGGGNQIESGATLTQYGKEYKMGHGGKATGHKVKRWENAVVNFVPYEYLRTTDGRIWTRKDKYTDYKVAEEKRDKIKEGDNDAKILFLEDGSKTIIYLYRSNKMAKGGQS